MKNVYELIEYSGPQYKFSVAWGYYVTSHIHREIEFGMVLEGCMHIVSSGREIDIHPGEFWYLNPCQCHELSAEAPDKPFAFLELQLPTSFFRDYFSKIDRIRIADIRLTPEILGDEACLQLRHLLYTAAMRYFTREAHFELRCTGDINHILANLLESAPHSLLSDDELRISNAQMPRIQRITGYIEEHYNEKLLLSDIAERENLSLSYLSHFFADHFGMPFQTYLQHIRCQRAGVMLVETDLSPSDISLACGFSALKYMNRGFDKLFGCSPSAYRSLLRKKMDRGEKSASHEKQIRLHRESGLFEIVFKPENSAEYLRSCADKLPPILRPLESLPANMV